MRERERVMGNRDEYERERERERERESTKIKSNLGLDSPGRACEL